jgi:hypothetical protein
VCQELKEKASKALQKKCEGVWSTSQVFGWKEGLDEIAIEAKTVQQNFI